MTKDSRAKTLLKSGIIFSAINFMTGLGNLAFQSVMGNQLQGEGQYRDANSAINGIMPLLGLLTQVAAMTVTHYVAHYNAIGDTVRLQGLLAGCRKFLFRLTVVCSILVAVSMHPLSMFFNYGSTLMIVVMGCTIVGLWTSLLTGLCQGLSWFNRFAIICFFGMLIRVSFGYIVTLKWPRPEWAVVATTVGLLPYLYLLRYRKELSLGSKATPISPWNHEFMLYFVVSAAFVVGNYCFSLSDLLVMQHYNKAWNAGSGDAYVGAERLAYALPTTVSPLLTILFTNRTVEHTADALRAQLKLLVLYAGGLIFGAACLYTLRHLCLRVIGQDTPEAAEMIGHLALSMVFVGLPQAVGTWALASRWSKISLLYGALGIGYTILIFAVGKSPVALLQTMPIAASAAFVLLVAVWITAMRRHKPVA